MTVSRRHKSNAAGKTVAAVGTLIFTEALHLVGFFGGLTSDGSVLWALLTGFWIWLAFLIVAALLKAAVGLGIIAIPVNLLFGGVVLWLMYAITMTSTVFNFGQLWLVSVPYVVLGSIAAYIITGGD